eukprot:GILI01005529.1.p2 GENE.GILI01005529.1~~GILI01005529.1.p2  ORF type:complete len:235 (+),score=67.43 GILI01005529.1:82-786(+)
MVEATVLQDVFSTLGSILAISLFASGLNVARVIIIKKEVGNAEPFPYYSMFLNCYLWFLYGIFDGKRPVWLTNGVGVILSVFTIVIFQIYEKKNAKKLAMINSVGAVLSAVLGVGVYFGVSDNYTRSQIMGYVANVANVIMYGSPLKQLAEVLKTRNTADVPILLSIVSFLCSSAWLIFGLLVTDWFIVIPNVLGTLLNIVQLAILGYLFFGTDARHTQLAEDEEGTPYIKVDH